MADTVAAGQQFYGAELLVGGRKDVAAGQQFYGAELLVGGGKGDNPNAGSVTFVDPARILTTHQTYPVLPATRTVVRA